MKENHYHCRFIIILINQFRIINLKITINFRTPFQQNTNDKKNNGDAFVLI